jgi:hypothetical protein
MRKLIVVAVMLMLAGCGGGGGDSRTQSTQTTTPTPTPIPTPPAGITISGKLAGATDALSKQVVLVCVHPIANPTQWGCGDFDAHYGGILATSASADVNGNYTFDHILVQYHQPPNGLPIPSGYTWKVIPYQCSIYSYGNTFILPLPPTPFTCTPTERTFDLTASISGINFLMWPTP